MGARSRGLGVAALLYAGIGTVLVAIARVSVASAQGQPASWRPVPARAFFAGWMQFDAWEYVGIARDGYWYEPESRSPVVFFPFFPLVVRAVSNGLGWDPVAAAIAVSAMAGLSATLLLWTWLGDRGLDPASRMTTLVVFLLYPYGWFLYGVAYSDALFLALVLAAFVLAARGHLLVASLVGIAITATRPTGLAVVPGLLVLGWQAAGVLTVPDAATGWVRRWQVPIRFDRSAWRPVLAAPLLSLAGVAGYATYLGVRFGDPLLLTTEHSQWQGTGWRTWFKAGFVDGMVRWDDPIYSLTVLGQAIVVVGVIASVPAVGRRFGWGYAAYVATLVAIPAIGTRDFMGAGRYLLPAFPVFALAGTCLAERPRLRVAWCAVASVLLVAMVVGYSRSRLLT